MKPAELMAGIEALGWFYSDAAKGVRLPAATGLRLRRIVRWAEQQQADFEAERMKRIEEFGQRKEDGELVVVTEHGQQIVPWREDCRAEATQRMEELFATDLPAPPEVLHAPDFAGVGLPPSVVLGLGPLLVDSEGG